LNVQSVVALEGIFALVFVNTIAWFWQIEIILLAAGGFDVKDTVRFCPQTPILLTIKKITRKKDSRKEDLYVFVCKKSVFGVLIYANGLVLPKIV
jgi:hypothetical protein